MKPKQRTEEFLPKISVIMPVFNTANYLREAIDSILNQSFTNFELIIIDDASTDESKSIIKSYSDLRIVVIENKINRGYVFGLNFAFSIARGEFIARMDSDDISEKTRLEKQLHIFELNPQIVACGTNIRILNSDLIKSFPETDGRIRSGFLKSNVIAHPTVMLRKSKLVIEGEELYYSKFMPSEDYELWTRLLDHGQFYNIQEPLLKYRIHENQISNYQSVRQFIISEQIRRNYIIKYYLNYFNMQLNDLVECDFESINCLVHFKLFLKFKNHNYVKKNRHLFLFFHAEMKKARSVIYSSKEYISLTSFFCLLYKYPNILWGSEWSELCGYCGRVLLYTFVPSKRLKNPYLY